MSEDKTIYTATLKVTSKGTSEGVQIELTFDPKRDTLETQPMSYMVMDFFSESAVLPFVGMAEEFAAQAGGGFEVAGNRSEN